MTRKIVIATQAFTSADVAALSGKDWRVDALGVVQQGTRFPADHPIVRNHPTQFMDADDEPGEDAGSPGGPEWRSIVVAYRRCAKPRPSQLEVARALGFDTEQPLRDRLRALDIPHWRAVHALIQGQQ